MSYKESEKRNEKEKWKNLNLPCYHLEIARQSDFLQNYGVLCNSCNLCEDWMASGIGWRHDIEMRSN